MDIQEIPADFPRHQTGAVSGVQPKVLARKFGDRYVQGLTEEELWERYDSARDLVEQFVSYCQRKARENPSWSLEFNINRAATGLDQKIAGGLWNVTVPERDWIIQKLRTRMSEAPIEGGA